MQEAVGSRGRRGCVMERGGHDSGETPLLPLRGRRRDLHGTAVPSCREQVPAGTLRVRERDDLQVHCPPPPQNWPRRAVQCQQG